MHALPCNARGRRPWRPTPRPYQAKSLLRTLQCALYGVRVLHATFRIPYPPRNPLSIRNLQSKISSIHLSVQTVPGPSTSHCLIFSSRASSYGMRVKHVSLRQLPPGDVRGCPANATLLSIPVAIMLEHPDQSGCIMPAFPPRLLNVVKSRSPGRVSRRLPICIELQIFTWQSTN